MSIYNYEFTMILNAVKNKIFEIKSHGKLSNIDFNIIIDSDKCFRMFCDSSKCIAEILVEKAEFAPYRFVKIEVLSTDPEAANPIYSWYDCPDDSIDTVINRVNETMILIQTYDM